MCPLVSQLQEYADELKRSNKNPAAKPAISEVVHFISKATDYESDEALRQALVEGLREAQTVLDKVALDIEKMPATKEVPLYEIDYYGHILVPYRSGHHSGKHCLRCGIYECWRDECNGRQLISGCDKSYNVVFCDGKGYSLRKYEEGHAFKVEEYHKLFNVPETHGLYRKRDDALVPRTDSTWPLYDMDEFYTRLLPSA